MKTLIKFIISLAIMFVSVYYIYNYYSQTNEENYKKISIIGNNTEFISSLKEENNNTEIVLYIEIPEVFGLPIPQSGDNSYYYNHDIKQNDNKNGSPFLDYRNMSLNDKKLIIYGHNKSYRSLPFNNILNYQNEDFYKKHPTIYLYKEDGKKAYNIFASFIESKDMSYLDITGLNNIEFYEHLLKFKDKSLYDTKTTIDGDSKVLVLVTNATTDYDEETKYQVVIAIEDKYYNEEK